MIRQIFIALLFTTQLHAQTFEDRSASLPFQHVYDGDWEHFVGGGVAVFDCNQDGKPEIFAAGGTNPATLFINRTTKENWRFEQDQSFDPLLGVTGAYPLDFNNDGLIDLMVLRVGENYLYRGKPDCQFENTELPTDDSWSTAFSATWESRAQYPTLAIGNYVDRSNPDGPFNACDDNQIYRPSNAGYAEPETLSPGYCPLSILFSDWSRTGNIDLRLSNDRHYYVRDGHEQMYRIPEDRYLTEADNWKNISIWGMGIASTDITGDSYPDVVLTSMGDQLLQFGGPNGFEAAPFSKGTYAHRPFIGDDGRPSTGWHAQFDDINNDGLQDLFIAKGNVDQMPGLAIEDPNNLLIQTEDGTFVEAAYEAGISTTDRSRGAALADFNGDGLLDLVVVNRRAPMELYENTTADTGNWIGITPRQAGSNTFAIGAWIDVRNQNEEIAQTKELTIGGGHVSGILGPIHFGLGNNTDAEVRIIWPDGTNSKWTNLSANQAVNLWKGKAGQLILGK